VRPCELGSEVKHVGSPLILHFFIAASVLVHQRTLKKLECTVEIRSSFGSGGCLSATDLGPGQKIGKIKRFGLISPWQFRWPMVQVGSSSDLLACCTIRRFVVRRLSHLVRHHSHSGFKRAHLRMRRAAKGRETDRSSRRPRLYF
jgi:hypothetical protein